ncbi:Hpt domain-containing protein [Cellvibrio sp.]|uniref:hybrid sensor histidine kinase/response regulator n=1 Tax=Cellvibrio sp. TaxID=1965322 RepID=UPI00396486DE
MADNRNFAALDWLIHEIGETLKEARQALEAYVENPKDVVRIRFCLTHIHQVHGSLQMVEFFGAAMLAEEMEKLTQAMIQGAVVNPAEAQEVLMRSILQFPVYLDQVKATRKDNPLVVLPLLNDLRAVRGESLLTDTKLFVPNLAPAKKVTGTRSAAAQDNVQFQAMALKLRQMYQYAAAGYIRNVNSDENLAYLQKVFSRLHKLTQGTARNALWDICLALAEALEMDALEISVAIKNLLRQLDKEIKILAVHGTKALNSYTNDELIKNLLYYVARAGKHAPGFNPNSHLQRVYQTYHLDDALIEGKESGEDATSILSSPDPDAMRSVVDALKTELDVIKNALDLCLAGGDTQSTLNDALPVVKRIGDTMAVLGLGDLRKQILEQGAALEMVANSGSQLSQDQLMSIAGKVIEVEDALDNLAQQQSTGSEDTPASEADITLSRAKESVLREARNGLEHAKDAIIEYIASQWDRVHLQNVPDTLREIRGGLEIMPLPRAARILGACARYIEEQLLSQEITPQWSSLDTLADAITSVEYYLERLGGGSSEENDLLLTVAEESVASLGYAVAKVSRTDSSSLDMDTLRSILPATNIHTTPEAAEADEASLAAAYAAIQDPTNEVATDASLVTDTLEQTPVAEDEFAQASETSSDAETASQTIEAHEPPSLLKSGAPSIGNRYSSPETTISVSPSFLGKVEVALNTASAVEINEPQEIVADLDFVSAADASSEKAVEEPQQERVDSSVSAENVSDTVAEDATESIEESSETTAEDDDDNYIDDEIIEIFVEEAGEVLEAIAEYFPRWAKNFEDENSLTEFRRAFHTLKGSGRMVGANEVGELSWSIENMLNRVIDKTIEAGEPHVTIIEKVRAILPAMVEAFSQKLPNPHPQLSEHYRGLAESLAKGIVPDELASDAQPLQIESTATVDDQPAAMAADFAVPAAEFAEEITEAPDVAEQILDEQFTTEPSEQHSVELATDYLTEDGSDDQDAQLWDIFGAEAVTHLQTLREFITRMEEEAPCYEPPSDSIQRALHTLKGSAHMAEITPIAELAAPLEKFVKELRSYHVVLNDDILQLLRDAVTYTETGLAQIENGEAVDIPRLHQFTARVAELREIHVAPLVRQQELDENGKRPVDPELLSIFMAEEMNLLLDADKIIAQWQSAPEDVSVLQPVLGELRNLNRGAHHAYLPAMANLGEKLAQVYTQIIDKRLTCSEPLCRDINSAHLALLDMVDAIAAGQNLTNAPESILQSLDDLIAEAQSYPDASTEEPIAEQLATAGFEAVASLDEQVAVDAEPALPLIEEVDYEAIADDQIATLELAEDEALDAAENALADTLVVERIAADVAENEEDASLDLGDLVELDIEDVSISDDEIIAALPVAELDEDQQLHSEALDLQEADDDSEEITLELPAAEAHADETDDLEFIADESAMELPIEETSEMASSGDREDLVEPEEVAKLGGNAEDDETFEYESALDKIVEEESLADVASESDISESTSLEEALEREDALENEGTLESSGELEDIQRDAIAPVSVPPVVTAQKPQVPQATRTPISSFEDDEDFDPEIIEIFIEEAAELLEDIERALHDWQEDWNNTDCVEELKRCLHTFKGGARLAGLTDLGDLSHDFETTLIEMDADAEVDQNFFKTLNSYQDQLHSGVNDVRARLNGEIPDGAVEDYLETAVQSEEVLDQIADEPVFEPVSEDNPPEPQIEYTRPSLVVDNDRPNLGLGSEKPNVLTFAPKPKPPAAPLPKIPGAEFGGARQGSGGPAQVQHLAARRAGPQEVVKVSAELLEELVNLAGETSISRGRMEQQVSDLGASIEEMDATIHRLQEQLRRLDIETEAQVLFRQEQMAQHEQFDPLEMDRYSQLQQLSRSLIESASDLMDLKYTLADKTRDTETLLLQQSRINTDLQEGLMRSRMVPFSRLVPRLRRIVRQAADELGKEVNFELDNVEGELDRTVLERMVAPLEHMLRNAVDHGIESPEDRLASGKDSVGRITLSLGREGGDVMLRLADDGRGINLQRVREKAIERGLMAADAPLSEQDLMQFILHAGFSTADKVTQISGRGVGMDVVHSEIKQLGGAMFIDSRWGEGTEFTIRLPFTVSVNRALMVQIGDDFYAVPLNTIEGIVRVSPFELEHYYQDPDARFDYAGENYLVRYLGAMLDSTASPKLDGQSLPLPVILVRSTENTVALQVDRLLGSREIVVKTLGAQFASVRGVSGATVTGDGSVVVILDLHALIREQLALGLGHAILLDPSAVSAPAPVVEEAEKTIMVVDDSVTVRKVTGRFLEREGFRVITAKDGVEALQLLQDHIPDVMLLDIEMPRMDGFEVAKNIRTSSRLRNIPIIMITSRTGEKHREHAFELGVNKYMGKPYQEDLLLSNIKELIKL